MNYFNLQACLGHGNIIMDTFGGVLLCSILYYCSHINIDVTGPVEPSHSRLEMNYLQNIIYGHACFYT